jgi:hypothetical protein
MVVQIKTPWVVLVNCCNQTIVPFFNVPTSTIPYTGNTPTVTVGYLQTDGTLLFNGIMTQINIAGGVVSIDHGGGLQSGIIKLLN